MNYMKKTNYKYNYSKTAYIGSLIILILLTIGSGSITWYIFNKIREDGIYLLIFIGPCILFLFAFSSLFLHLFGYIKGKIRTIKNALKIVTSNPYIYYRELPNRYGIGIASLLLDSTIENEKDIVAIILNLCAKKYLILRKENERYIISVIKGIDSNLLGNEKYIMSLIINNNLKEIDYDEWFNYLIEDGISLNLFIEPEQYKQGPNMFKSVYHGGYLMSLKNYLEPTAMGKKELQKLLSFKRFLKDFGHFAQKNPEEIILWDYYLCYAQVFGLTERILKTGYKKLIENGSFEINDLESIKLDELIISK